MNRHDCGYPLSSFPVPGVSVSEIGLSIKKLSYLEDINVVIVITVHKNRFCGHVIHCVNGGNKRKRRYNYFISRLHPNNPERHMQRSCPVDAGNCMISPSKCTKIRLKPVDILAG